MQRVVVYSLMTLSVIGLVVVLVFVMLGYQFNSDDGKIEQGGLVQFDSQPSGAEVTIDGRAFGTRTASKTTMTAGQHYITMSREGYAPWQKSVTVVPGSVLWLNYARLVPTELDPKSVADFPTVTSAAPSPDAKDMAIIENASSPVLKTADLTREDAKIATLTIPAEIYTAPDAGKTQRFTIDSWDPDSRHILVRHDYNDDKTEWLVIDTDGIGDSKNVTRLLDITASKLRFSNSDSAILYAQIDGDIRKVNLNDATLSRPLITNVDTFDLYSDTMVTYASRPDETTGKRTVGYYVDGADAPRTVRTIDDKDAPLRFTVGRYFNETFEAIALGDTVEVLRGDLPRDGKTKISLKPVTTFQIPGGAQYLSDQTNGRFIVAQNGATYVTYDLELEEKTTTTLKGVAEVKSELKWLDKYHIWSDRDGMLRLYEFDGANPQDIMPVVPGMSATLNSNGKYLYGITKSVDGVHHLSRVQMILD
ncbi:PEGA domain-containing protein [Streptomyces caniscabiei]|uniref:PEGA domain-containing protein n=1 Tax=Streptomyces caniscabiei TaxID=2746961 RepID=UPI0029B7DE9B|nr:PEGA domain-containing protein [Streptomyces caniscabiei]MDX2776108.1 PEGA domain-containing protein [Streptomyces caniscabiei]